MNKSYRKKLIENLGNGFKNKHHSEETKQKIKNRIFEWYQKTGGLTREQKEKHKQAIKKAYKEGRLISPAKGKFGILSTNWRGGRFIDSEEYVNVYDQKTQRYYYEHRLVMEKYLERKLEKFEGVHHRNKNKSDNRIENLQLVIHNNHFEKIRCPRCLYEFLIK